MLLYYAPTIDMIATMDFFSALPLPDKEAIGDIFELQTLGPPPSNDLYNVKFQAEMHDDGLYYLMYISECWPIYTMQQKLYDLQGRSRKEFSAAFTHLESRAARAVSSLTLRMTGGETAFPDDDFDAGLLWSIEQIKQANRDLLAGLEALTIPADATFAEAQAVIAEAVAVVPWMPEEAGIAE